MSKKNRLKRQRNRMAYSEERRNFIKTLLIAGGGAALAGVGGLAYIAREPEAATVPYPASSPTPSLKGKALYERGYDVNPASLPRIELKRREFDRKLSPEEESDTLKLARDYLYSQRFPDPNDPKKIWFPERHQKAEKYDRDWFQPEPDAKYAERVIANSRKAIKHALAYWESPLLEAPSIEFHVPRKKEDISYDGIARETQRIYVCYATGDDTVLELFFNYGDKVVGFTKGLSRANAGTANRETTYYLGEKEVSVQQYDRQPIFLGLGEEIVYIVETPPLEILHHQLYEHTENHVLKELNASRNPDGSLGRDEINRISRKWIDREELFVHSLGELWLEAYNSDAGFGFSAYELRNKVYSHPDVPVFSERLRGRKMPEIIETYATQPERLLFK